MFTFGLQALALPSWWRRARLGLQLRRMEEWNEDALKLLSGICLFCSPRGREQPSDTYMRISKHSQHLHTVTININICTTHCWGHSPAAPVGEQDFAQSLMDESWHNEPQRVERRCSLSLWSCPCYREIPKTKPHKLFRLNLMMLGAF